MSDHDPFLSARCKLELNTWLIGKKPGHVAEISVDFVIALRDEIDRLAEIPMIEGLIVEAMPQGLTVVSVKDSHGEWREVLAHNGLGSVRVEEDALVEAWRQGPIVDFDK